MWVQRASGVLLTTPAHLERMNGRLPVTEATADAVAADSARPYRLCASYSRAPSAWRAVMPMVLVPSRSSLLPLLMRYGGRSYCSMLPAW